MTISNEFTIEQRIYLKSLNTPSKIQDFIDTIPYNHCIEKYVCKSPKRLLETSEKNRVAHCLEGALLAATCQRLNDLPPLLLELVGLNEDFHFIAPFIQNGLWGAMGQSETYILGWRNPIYRNIRELVLSYFPVYVTNSTNVLRSYTDPINITCFDDMNWMTTPHCLEKLGNKFDDFEHYNLFNSDVPIRGALLGLESALIRYPEPKA